MKNILKKISLFAVLGLITFAANAQRAYNVPTAVTTTFSAQYPHAQLKKWRSSKNVYTAFFRNDNKKYTATYAATGNWIRTERDIKRRSGLPFVLQSYLRRGFYASWHIDDMKRVRTPGANMYEVSLDNHSGSPFAYEDAGSRENKTLCFDDSGKLLNVTNE